MKTTQTILLAILTCCLLASAAWADNPPLDATDNVTISTTPAGNTEETPAAVEETQSLADPTQSSPSGLPIPVIASLENLELAGGTCEPCPDSTYCTAFCGSSGICARNSSCGTLWERFCYCL